MFFSGKGVNLVSFRPASHNPIVELPLAKRLIVPMQQHIGPPCVPLVKPQEHVDAYQKIAESSYSPAIHSPVFGTVIDIVEHPSPQGCNISSIMIEPDKDQRLGALPEKLELKTKEMLDIIKDLGIVGMGGAGFPTYLKLQPKHPVDTIILNGAECEPLMSSDYRIMIEYPGEIISGLQAEMKILGVKKAFIAIEGDKVDAIDSISSYIREEQIDNLTIKTLKTFYPQGAEKTLIYNTIGRICRQTMLPSEVGVVVSNVATARAIHQAVFLRKPLVERVITVAGFVDRPRNLLVKIGTPINDILSYCVPSGTFEKLIVGGPMMGLAQWTQDVPVIKTTTGVVVQHRSQVEDELHCIRCGMCLDACPNDLTPTNIAKAFDQDQIPLTEIYHAMECMECGCCSFVCPSKIQLVQKIRMAKQEICKRKKK